MASNDPPILEHLTWTEARDLLALRPVGLLPIGAIEAHGPHLPLNSDVIIATGMAKRGGAELRKRGVTAVVLPPVAYSVSFAGSCFPGTIPVGSVAFTAWLTELLDYLPTQGFRAICICNAHLEPAHVDAVRTAIDSSSAEVSMPIVFPDQRVEPWAATLGEEFNRGSRHAGMYETSILMAEAPGSIRRTSLEELEPVWIDLPEALRQGARDFSEAGGTLGYFGDPRAATSEYGNDLLDLLGKMICESVLEVLARRS